MKKIGILCPLFSLPNEFGIGDFSSCSYTFIDYLNTIGYSYWQILPLNPVDKFHSPYSSISSYAIDDIYVSLSELKKNSLILTYNPYSSKVKRVNFRKVRKYKELYWKEAYLTFKSKANYLTVIENFIDKERWVKMYATYVVLSRKNKGKPWNTWNKVGIEKEEVDEINYEVFKQYILLTQWNKIHNYAKSKGISIIGDIPFYVGYNSSDVYFNKESFILNPDGSPKLVAGVPPDYYNSEGQLWGNPIYDWDYLKNNNYSVIIDRIVKASKLYDVVRLDHFRAFDTYYTIDAKAENAKIGAWLEPPSYEFFDKLYNDYPNLNLIAEDLGYMRDEVYHLRDHYNIPGMQVVEFSIIDEELRHQFLSHVYKRENSIIYLSTHDSETTMEWLSKLDNDTYNALTGYLDYRFGHHHIMTNLFKYVSFEPANIVILAVWDVLRLGKVGRINVPGFTLHGNWNWRMKNFDGLNKNIKKLIGIAKKSNRIKQ